MILEENNYRIGRRIIPQPDINPLGLSVLSKELVLSFPENSMHAVLAPHRLNVGPSDQKMGNLHRLHWAAWLARGLARFASHCPSMLPCYHATSSLTGQVIEPFVTQDKKTVCGDSWVAPDSIATLTRVCCTADCHSALASRKGFDSAYGRTKNTNSLVRV